MASGEKEEGEEEGKEHSPLSPLWAESPVCCALAWELFETLVAAEHAFYALAAAEASRASSPATHSRGPLLRTEEGATTTTAAPNAHGPLLGVVLSAWCVSFVERLASIAGGAGKSSEGHVLAPDGAGGAVMNSHSEKLPGPVSTTPAPQVSPHEASAVVVPAVVCVSYRAWFHRIAAALGRATKASCCQTPRAEETAVLHHLCNLLRVISREAADWGSAAKLESTTSPNSTEWSLFRACLRQREALYRWARVFVELGEDGSPSCCAERELDEKNSPQDGGVAEEAFLAAVMKLAAPPPQEERAKEEARRRESEEREFRRKFFGGEESEGEAQQEGEEEQEHEQQQQEEGEGGECSQAREHWWGDKSGFVVTLVARALRPFSPSLVPPSTSVGDLRSEILLHTCLHLYHCHVSPDATEKDRPPPHDQQLPTALNRAYYEALPLGSYGHRCDGPTIPAQ